jgi:hypothetical protein
MKLTKHNASYIEMVDRQGRKIQVSDFRQKGTLFAVFDVHGTEVARVLVEVDSNNVDVKLAGVK